MDPGHAAIEAARQKIVRADGDGDIDAAREMQEIERIAGGLRGIDIAADRADADQLDLGRGEQIGQRHGIVDAGIAVEVDGAARGGRGQGHSVSGGMMKRLATKAATVIAQEMPSAVT